MVRQRLGSLGRLGSGSGSGGGSGSGSSNGVPGILLGQGILAEEAALQARQKQQSSQAGRVRRRRNNSSFVMSLVPFAGDRTGLGGVESLMETQG